MGTPLQSADALMQQSAQPPVQPAAWATSQPPSQPLGQSPWDQIPQATPQQAIPQPAAPAQAAPAPWGAAPAAAAPWGAPAQQVPPQQAPWGTTTPDAAQPQQFGGNYGGYGSTGGYAGGPAEPPRKSSKAPIIVALIVVLALIVGIVAYVFSRNNNTNTPSGNPTTTSTSSPTPTAGTSAPAPTSTSTTGTRTAVRLTQVGDCFELSTSANYTTPYAYAWVLPCTQPHDSEVIFNQSMTASSYPDDNQWSAWFQQYCYPAFEAYVGSSTDATRLDMQYIYPEADTWSGGDQHLVCFVVDPEGDRTTSVQGSGE